MSRCIRCAGEARFGALCEEHANQLATCADITVEQLRFVGGDKPSAWLIDQWGATHPIGDVTTIGRGTNGCEVAVLHASVSAHHALIECGDDMLARLSDRGSLNGTFVNGEKVARARLFDGDVVRFGEVSFYFTLSEVPPIEAARGAGRTVPSKPDDFAFNVRVQVGADELRLSATDSGGIGVAGDTEITFGRLEFDLLVQLSERRLERASASDAYMSTKELTSALRFQSTIADSDNVRELVRRVRRKVKRAGLEDLIQSRQGAGYRLGWPARRL